jgi:cysteine synthase
LMKLEGIFGGSSSGCIAAAAAAYCVGLEGGGKNVLAILPDGGRGYMSTIYDDTWMQEKFPNSKFTR